MPGFALARQVVMEATVGRQVSERAILRTKIEEVAGSEAVHLLFIVRHLALEYAE